MFKKLMIKYYFWKLKTNRIDIKTVAMKLSVPINKLKKEYNKYNDPFKKIKTEIIFTFIAVCVSVFSVFISLATLNEMKAQRELTYKPDLRVYENVIYLYWDNEGKQIRREDDYTHRYKDNQENVLYAVYLNIDNIGTGNAKEIKYNWMYADNIKNFNLFLDNDTVKINLLKKDNIIEINYKDRWIFQSRMDGNDLESYISQGMQKRVIIPETYLDLLTLYCYEQLPLSSEIEYSKSLKIDDFPKLYINISYKNIQGIETKKKVKLGFEPIIYNKEENGEGNCNLRIRNLSEEIIDMN